MLKIESGSQMHYTGSREGMPASDSGLTISGRPCSPINLIKSTILLVLVKASRRVAEIPSMMERE